MTAYEKIAAALLAEFSERLGNAGCNDTEAERFGMSEREFAAVERSVAEWVAEIGDDADGLGDGSTPDWLLADWAAAALSGALDRERERVAVILNAAREGDIDSDLRSIREWVVNGDDPRNGGDVGCEQTRCVEQEFCDCPDPRPSK